VGTRTFNTYATNTNCGASAVVCVCAQIKRSHHCSATARRVISPRQPRRGTSVVVSLLDG
jgi:hypothetical protein